MAAKVHAVGIVFEDEAGRVLVLKRHPNDPEGETWGLVGGKIEDGEDKAQAAIRETEEEIGHVIDPPQLKFLNTYHWDREDLDITFEVFRLPIVSEHIRIQIDRTESTEHMWSAPATLHQRPDLMIGLYPILEDHYHL